MNENDILGFDPAQLTVNAPQEPSSTGNSLIYRARPAESKSEDGIYRASIRVIYNPFSLKDSVLEQQSYAMQDQNGFFTAISSLTNNDKSCPIFKAWKQCHFSNDPKLKKQAELKPAGYQRFEKRYARYVTIQVIEDINHPELNGQFLLWKCPKSVWDLINNKQNPASDKKAKIPVMDFLFGRQIDLEVTPGPDDKANPERKTREISYSTTEISDEIVSVTDPQGKSLLTSDEQDILDTYIEEMTKKVWKEKDPAVRAQNEAEIRQEENTKQLGAIYKKVLDKIKTFCPNLVEELGYHPWSDELAARVQNWINIILQGNDPAQATPAALTGTAVAAVDSQVANPAPQVATPTPQVATPVSDNDDLPF
jgi:hypothetical protein